MILLECIDVERRCTRKGEEFGEVNMVRGRREKDGQQDDRESFILICVLLSSGHDVRAF